MSTFDPAIAGVINGIRGGFRGGPGEIYSEIENGSLTNHQPQEINNHN
jgi:hypothetical protein